MAEELVIDKGRDGTIELTVYAGNGRGDYVQVRVREATPAGATSIPIDRLDYTMASGDMLQLGDGLVVTVVGAHAVGAAALTVSALEGAIRAGEVLRKLADLTGYGLELEVLERAGDAEAVLSISGAAVTVPSQGTTATRGRVQFRLAAEDTADVAPRAYAGVVWRRDSGNYRKLWPTGSGVASVVVQDAGFL